MCVGRCFSLQKWTASTKSSAQRALQVLVRCSELFHSVCSHWLQLFFHIKHSRYPVFGPTESSCPQSTTSLSPSAQLSHPGLGEEINTSRRPYDRVVWWLEEVSGGVKQLQEIRQKKTLTFLSP